MKRMLFGMIICCIVGACSPAQVGTSTYLPPTHTVIVPSPTAKPTQTLVVPSLTPLPQTATATAGRPSVTPLPECVSLIYGEYAQFEIIDPLGQRVLVDIYDPAKLSNPVSDRDILLTTHTHWDHFNEEFQAAFQGQQLFVSAGFLDNPGVKIQGLLSAHNAGDRFRQEGGSNTIYLIEIGGLRIAHFGDIGQNVLTDEQLEILGEVDIAITQLNNHFSEMSATNRKGLNLMDQLMPRLVIPTHLNLDTTKLAIAQWSGFFVDSSSIEICLADLGEPTQFLLVGDAAETMINYVELEEWGNQ